MNIGNSFKKISFSKFYDNRRMSIYGSIRNAMRFDHDFGYSFPLFPSLLIKEERRNGEYNDPIYVKKNKKNIRLE